MYVGSVCVLHPRISTLLFFQNIVRVGTTSGEATTTVLQYCTVDPYHRALYNTKTEMCCMCAHVRVHSLQESLQYVETAFRK